MFVVCLDADDSTEYLAGLPRNDAPEVWARCEDKAHESRVTELAYDFRNAADALACVAALKASGEYESEGRLYAAEIIVSEIRTMPLGD